jgi:hypothetical protein
MAYYNYHATIRRLIKDGKLISYHYSPNYNKISPALVLLFNDSRHPVMVVREHRFLEYQQILPKELLTFKKEP